MFCVYFTCFEHSGIKIVVFGKCDIPKTGSVYFLDQPGLSLVNQAFFSRA